MERSRDAAGARLRIVMGHLPLYGVAALTTFDARTGDRVDLVALPRCISGYNGSIFRVDVPQAPRGDSRS